MPIPTEQVYEYDLPIEAILADNFMVRILNATGTSSLVSALTVAHRVHTHVEADITNLDKYTQAEVNTLVSGLQGQINTHTTQIGTNSTNIGNVASDLGVHIADLANPHDVSFAQLITVPSITYETTGDVLGTVTETLGNNVTIDLTLEDSANQGIAAIDSSNISAVQFTLKDGSIFTESFGHSHLEYALASQLQTALLRIEALEATL